MIRRLRHRPVSRRLQAQRRQTAAALETLEDRVLLAGQVRLIGLQPGRTAIGLYTDRNSGGMGSCGCILIDESPPHNTSSPELSGDIERSSGNGVATLDYRGQPTFGPDGFLQKLEIQIDSFVSGVSLGGAPEPAYGGANTAIYYQIEVTGGPVFARVTGDLHSEFGADGTDAEFILGSDWKVRVEPDDDEIPSVLPVSETLMLAPGIYGVGGFADSFADVLDDDSPEAIAEIDLVVMFGIDQPPDLEAIDPQDVKQGELLSFTTETTDLDTDAVDLRYSLDMASTDKGMTINSPDGTFRWTPGADQIGEHNVTVTVTDDTDLTDSETFMISVLESSEFRWDETQGGDFDVPGNWDLDSVPGMNANVFFDIGGDYTVSFPAEDITNRSVDVGSGTVTLSLLADYTLSGGDSEGHELDIEAGKLKLLGGKLKSENSRVRTLGSLEIDGSNRFETDTLSLTNGGTRTGLVVRGSAEIDTLLTVADGQAVVDQGGSLKSPKTILGSSGTGWLTVNRGGSVVTAQLEVGNNIGKLFVEDGGRFVFDPAAFGLEDDIRIGEIGRDDGVGDLIVTGVHASLQTPSRFEFHSPGANTLFVGRDSHGTILIEDGGSAMVEGFVFVGQQDNGTGDLNVRGINSRSGIRSTLLIADDSGSTGLFLGENGGVGTALVDGGALLRTSRAQLGRFLGRENLGVGQATVRGRASTENGVRSRWEITELLDVGGLEGTRLIIEDGGEVVIGDPESNVAVDEHVLQVGRGGHQHGILTISGNGSVLKTTPGFVSVGKQGTGELLLEAGAEFDGFSGLFVGIDDPEGVLGTGRVRVGANAILRGFLEDSQIQVLTGGELRIEGGLAGAQKVFVDRAPNVPDQPERDGGRLVVNSGTLFTAQLHVGEDQDPGHVELTNGGQVTLIPFGDTPFVVDVDANGLIDFTDGSVEAGDIGGHVVSRGQFVLGAGSTLRGTGTIRGPEFTESGGVNNFMGTVSSGNSPGTLTIDTNYTQGPEGTMVIEVAGPEPGADYDQLIVTGNVVLDGKLELVFLDGYVPGPNDTFHFLVSNSITGQFDEVTVDGLPNGMDVEFDFGAGGLVLEVTGEPAGGAVYGRTWNDLNGDGLRHPNEPWLNGWTVELLDMRGNVVQTATTMDRDFDNSGTIDPETERGWYWLRGLFDDSYLLREVQQDGWRQTAPFDDMSLDVWLLDQDRNFQFTGNAWENWGGLGEKWFHSNQDWHYITPDGDVFQWNRSPRSALSGNLVMTTGEEYFHDPSLIYDAELPAASQVTITSGQIVSDINFGSQELSHVPCGDFQGSGNVVVSLRHRNLTLTGDDAANGIAVYLNDGGTITIAGLGDTTINGSHEPVVTTGWTSIPRDLRAQMNGGDDALCLHDVTVNGSVRVDFGAGNDRLLGDNVRVVNSFNVVDDRGDNVIGFSRTRFEGRFTAFMGSGNDVVYASNTTFADDVTVLTGSGNDLLFVRDSIFEDHVGIWLQGDSDAVAALGSNQFRRSLTLDGGSSDDSYEVDPLTTFGRMPTLRALEADSIPDPDTILDNLMQDLANLGLDGILHQ